MKVLLTLHFIIYSLQHHFRSSIIASFITIRDFDLVMTVLNTKQLQILYIKSLPDGSRLCQQH